MDLTEDIKTVQNSLGHTDISTTQRYVSRIKQTRVDRANQVYNRWQAQLGPDATDEEQAIAQQCSETIVKHFYENRRN